MDGDDELFPPHVREARHAWLEALARHGEATNVMLEAHREWVAVFDTLDMSDEYRRFCALETATSLKLAADRESRLRGVAYTKAAGT